ADAVDVGCFPNHQAAVVDARLIQPMSSPMMKRMLGFCCCCCCCCWVCCCTSCGRGRGCCCAATGVLAPIPTATDASSASHRFCRTFIEDLLTSRLGTGRAIEQPHRGLFYCRREQSLRLKTSGDHAGLVGVGTLHVLTFSTRKFAVSLVDAPVDRRVPCSVLLGRLLGCRLRGETAAENPNASAKKSLFALLMIYFLSVG